MAEEKDMQAGIETALEQKQPAGPDGEAPGTAVVVTASPEGDKTAWLASELTCIVGIGASAGGLEALGEFFSQMPPNSGMAFVVVMHLDPTYESMLDRLLQKYTPMKVSKIKDGQEVQSNQVYVIPPDHELGILHGRLQLLTKMPIDNRQKTIDSFFRHLADDQGPRAGCMILSGGGADGTLGLQAIKEKGGLVIVQDPETAAHRSMPSSAVNTGLADYILPPDQMPEALLNYSQRGPLVERGLKLDEKFQEELNKIFLLLRAETGQDFSYYRANTLVRRIAKRMTVHRLDEIGQYTHFLRQHPAELNKLFYELLIGVTQFFRDVEAFEVFKTRVLPALFQDRTEGQPLRVWVSGCSTGEEAYSLAILIHEYKQNRLPGLKVDIFATDINLLVIEKARVGQYPASIVADVPEAYLARYFIKQDHSYQAKSEIREMLIFAEQSLLKDPPFSKLDLISCRNLLIYLKPETQKKVLSLFQYALRPGGFLFLGSSENIGEFSDFFAPVDRKWRIFRRTSVRAVPPGEAEFFSLTVPNPVAPASYREPIRDRRHGEERLLTEKMLLEHYNPVGILINDKQEILYTYGNVDLYLKVAPGEARLYLIDMVRTGLEMELVTAIRQVSSQNEAITRREVWVKANGGDKFIDFTIKPVSTLYQRDLFLIIIEEARPQRGVSEQSPTLLPAEVEGTRLIQLQKELESSRRHLQNMIEELQVANEEHRSFAEELQSANEELQSTNEELTTSQEELQAVNEELVTANTEIQIKNMELRQTNNDLHNLLTGTEIATVFLDTRLNIKRFTPAATQIINFISSDVGRPIKHTVSNLKYENLTRDIERVLDTLNTKELEVETETGRWYNMRILPYRTVENVIDGVVITFAEITVQKQTEAALRHLNEELRATQSHIQALIDTLHEGALILDPALRVILANRSFYRQFQVTPQEIEGQYVYALKQIGWDGPSLRQRLEAIIPNDQPVEQYEFEDDSPGLGRRKVRLRARRMALDAQGKEKILLTIEDIKDSNS